MTLELKEDSKNIRTTFKWFKQKEQDNQAKNHSNLKKKGMKYVLPRSTASLNACRMVAILNAGLNLQTCYS